MMKRRCWMALATVALAGCAAAPSLSPAPGATAMPGPSWQRWALPGKRATDYRLTVVDGRRALHAQADTAASMLRRPLTLEAPDLGRLKFSWRVPQLIADADLTQRDTEDAPVRIVLAFDGDHGQLSLKNRSLFDLGELLTGERPPYATLMYVWDNRAAAESVIVNPRTDRIRKIVAESGAQRLNQWLSYDRDVSADYQRAFGEAPGRLIGVAVMTDSDNTRSRTEGYYGAVELFNRAGQLQ